MVPSHLDQLRYLEPGVARPVHLGEGLQAGTTRQRLGRTGSLSLGSLNEEEVLSLFGKNILMIHLRRSCQAPGGAKPPIGQLKEVPGLAVESRKASAAL